MKIISIKSNEEPNVGDIIQDYEGNLALVDKLIPNSNSYHAKYLAYGKKGFTGICSGSNFDNKNKSVAAKLNIYIVDTEAISNVDETIVNIFNNCLSVFKGKYAQYFIKEKANYHKIITTNNQSLQLPQLSQQALQTIVDNNGKLEEFDIKFKCGKYNRGGDDSCGICEIIN